MISVPHPAFGYVIFRTSMLAGETLNDDLMTDNVMVVSQQTTPTDHGRSGNTGRQYIFYILSGKHEYKNKETGKTYTFSRGYCSLEQGLPVGSYDAKFLESGDFLCFNTFAANKDKLLPPLEVFKLEAGKSTTLPKGIKLFLAEGLLTIDDTTVPSMKQIKVVNEDKIATAVSDCYGLIFKN
jgi:hypothetical protein